MPSRTKVCPLKLNVILEGFMLHLTIKIPTKEFIEVYTHLGIVWLHIGHFVPSQSTLYHSMVVAMNGSCSSPPLPSKSMITFICRVATS